MQKIAVWETVRGTYRFLFSDLRRFLLIGWFWITIPLVFYLIAYLFHVAGIKPIPALMVPIAILFGVVWFGSNFFFAVAWHRAILLSEVPRATSSLRFKKRVWRFFLYFLAIGAMAIPFTVVMGLTFLLSFDDSEKINGFPLHWVNIGIVAVLTCAYLIVAARMMLALPAAAVEETGDLIEKSWKRTRKNTLRIMVGGFLSAAPFTIILLGFGILKTLATRLLDPSHLIFEIFQFSGPIIGTIGNLMENAIGIGFISLTYQQLVGNWTPPETTTN